MGSYSSCQHVTLLLSFLCRERVLLIALSVSGEGLHLPSLSLLASFLPGLGATDRETSGSEASLASGDFDSW